MSDEIKSIIEKTIGGSRCWNTYPDEVRLVAEAALNFRHEQCECGAEIAKIPTCHPCAFAAGYEKGKADQEWIFVGIRQEVFREVLVLLQFPSLGLRRHSQPRGGEGGAVSAENITQQECGECTCASDYEVINRPDPNCIYHVALPAVQRALRDVRDFLAERIMRAAALEAEHTGIAYMEVIAEFAEGGRFAVKEEE